MKPRRGYLTPVLFFVLFSNAVVAGELQTVPDEARKDSSADTAVAIDDQVRSYENKVNDLFNEAQKRRAEYVEMWKRVFMQTRGMTKAYFDEHFSITRSYAEKLNCSIRFYVHYNYAFDWIKLKDPYVHFDILYFKGLKPCWGPRKKIDVFLNEEEIFEEWKTVSGSAKAPESLKFVKYEDAFGALQNEIGPVNRKIQISFGGVWPPEWPFKGVHEYDPSMSGFGIVDEKNNKCVYGRLNLVTGEIIVNKINCVTWN